MHDPSPQPQLPNREEATEQQRLRGEVEMLQQQVQQYQALVDMVAHDLNTPLTTLQGYLDLITSEVRESGAHLDYLRIMQNSIDRITFTIGQMYDVISMEVGQLALYRKATAPADLLHRTAQEHRLIVEHRRQTLRVRSAKELPAVDCDEMRVLQVLQNLISNASKYSAQHTSITLRAALEPDRTAIRFTISDQGHGIDAALLPFVFERAFRAQGTAHQVKGAGLGLYLARLLVELHGGRIWCDSTVGRGSSFHFTLPISDSASDD
jgi:signal transduction histidine kinase